MSFQLTLDAELNIEEIYLYSLANFGEKKADQYHLELTEHFLSVVENPKIGRSFEFAKPKRFTEVIMPAMRFTIV